MRKSLPGKIYPGPKHCTIRWVWLVFPPGCFRLGDSRLRLLLLGKLAISSFLKPSASALLITFKSNDTDVIAYIPSCLNPGNASSGSKDKQRTYPKLGRRRRV